MYIISITSAFYNHKNFPTSNYDRWNFGIYIFPDINFIKKKIILNAIVKVPFQTAF